MQNLQNKNKIIPLTPSHHQKKYRLLKCKGKPFWLNLSQFKNQNYEKYKIELNPQTSFINQTQQLTTAHQQHQRNSQKQSFLQSLESFNQNYEQDFQSYKSTIKQQISSKIKIKNQQTHHQSTSNKKLNIKLIQIESRIHKTPKRKVNLSSLSKINTEKTNKTLIQSRIKTQQPLKSQTVDIQKFIYLNQNSKYLQRQNQKMVQIIKQMRQLLPILKKNQQQITQQRWQINSLKGQVQKSASPEYSFELEKSRSFLESNKKLIEQNIKKLNSPKRSLTESSILKKDDYLNLLSQQQRKREQLLCKLRLYTLREEKSLQLDKKIELYQKIIEKLSTRQKLKSYSSLERRKIFLEWDIERMKNQFDLRILQENLQVQSLNQQINLLQRQILDHENQFIGSTLRLKNQNLSLGFDEDEENKNKIKNYSIVSELPALLSPQKKEKFKQNQNLTSRILFKKSPKDQKTIFTKKIQKQKHTLSLHQKSLPEIHSNKNSFIPKK